MTEMEQPQNSVDQRIADFEQQNPQVAETIRLFGMSLAQYQGVLNAMYAPRVITSTSSNPQDQPRHE